MGIVNGNPMGMGISMVGEWEWLYGNGRLKGIPAHLYCIVPGLQVWSKGNHCYAQG